VAALVVALSVVESVSAALPIGGAPGGVTGLVKNRQLGLCLNQHPVQVQQGVVHLWRCDEENRNARWTFDTMAKEFRSQHGGCLHADKTGLARVRTASCDGDSASSGSIFKWKYEASTGSIRNGRGACLTATASDAEKVHLRRCDSRDPEQQWDLLGRGGEADLGEAMSYVGNSACEVSAWSTYSDCTKACGSGVQKRTRAIVKAANKAAAAACGDLVETRACATQPCASLRSCEVGPWSAFERCTHVCGGGTQIRTREVLQTAEPGAVGCPTLLDERPCNTFGCVDKHKSQDVVVVMKGQLDMAKSVFDTAIHGVTPNKISDVLSTAKAYAKALADGADSETPTVQELAEGGELGGLPSLGTLQEQGSSFELPIELGKAAATVSTTVQDTALQAGLLDDAPEQQERAEDRRVEDQKGL